MTETLVDGTDSKLRSIGKRMDSFMMRGSIEGGVGLETGLTSLLPDSNDNYRLKAIDTRDITCDALFGDEAENLFHVYKAIINDPTTGRPKLIYAIRQLNALAKKSKIRRDRVVIMNSPQRRFGEFVIDPNTDMVLCVQYDFGTGPVDGQKSLPKESPTTGHFENISEFIAGLVPITNKELVASVVETENQALVPLFHNKIPVYNPRGQVQTG